MLGVRSAQRGLLEADHLYLDYVGRGSFYGFLASLRGQLFRDEEFAELIAQTMAAIACPQVWWPLRCCCKPPSATPKPNSGRILISGGRWRWGLRWRTGPLPRARCSCFEPS